jgi:hypothetical protein
MKYIILFFFISSLSSVIAGLVLDVLYSEKLIGFGVLGLFFIVFPLFTYHRWKDRNINDYMLTKENLEKMRETEKKRN